MECVVTMGTIASGPGKWAGSLLPFRAPLTLLPLTHPLPCPSLFAGEIARVALKRGLIKCTGKTPEATMASAL